MRAIKIYRKEPGPSKIIAIVLEINTLYDCIVIWNLEKLEEKGLFDVMRPYEILWNDKGYPYIVSKDGVILT